MSVEESSNGGSRVLLTDGAAVAATSTGGAYDSGGVQLRPRQLTTASHYETLWLSDSGPFKDGTSGLFKEDGSEDLSRPLLQPSPTVAPETSSDGPKPILPVPIVGYNLPLPYVRYDLWGSYPETPPKTPPEIPPDLLSGSSDLPTAQQEQIWRTFWIQLQPHVSRVALLESVALWLVGSLLCMYGPILPVLFLEWQPLFPLPVLVPWYASIVLVWIKHRIVHRRLDAMRAICNAKRDKFECFGYLPEFEATMALGRIVPTLYFVAADKLCRRYDVSNNESSFHVLVTGDGLPLGETALRGDWIEFWSLMTNVCQNRLLYWFLALSFRGSVVALFATAVVWVTSRYKSCGNMIWIAVSALIASKFCDLYVYPQKLSAKVRLVHEFSLRFAKCNVFLELRTVNVFHPWLGLMERHHACFFFPTCAGDGLLQLETPPMSHSLRCGEPINASVRPIKLSI
jgi:hypothetical protein